jgi:hypothetical protein
MHTPTIIKETSDSFIIGRDFSPWLKIGETITSNTVTAIDQNGSSETTPMISGATYVDTVASFRIAAGNAGDEVTVTMTVGTSLSNTYVYLLRVRVQ